MSEIVVTIEALAALADRWERCADKQEREPDPRYQPYFREHAQKLRADAGRLRATIAYLNEPQTPGGAERSG